MAQPSLFPAVEESAGLLAEEELLAQERAREMDRLCEAAARLPGKVLETVRRCGQ